ncbi:MAG: cyclase family protein [Clostridia bacterium]|nr:cyclase family protein [Clostridia bacterium]
MKIYDISQEVFSCRIYPGDPKPEKISVSAIENGDLYNLTSFSMCAHNGTHIDAPSHFINNSKSVDKLSLGKMIGYAMVIEHSGSVNEADAIAFIDKLKADFDIPVTKLLIKGNATVTYEAAKVFAENKMDLIGNESQTVGPMDSPMQVHLELLNAEVILLEGINLTNVPEGIYFLNAAPLNLGDSDGAPCRAILIDFDN